MNKNNDNHVSPQFTLPPSVNMHFWRPCNMRCAFCFATYEDTRAELPRGHLDREALLDLVDRLAKHGARKLTFVGGEPTLCPWLGELIDRAKAHELTTMLVSNGWKLREPGYLENELRSLDWLTLSVDSVDEQTNRESGRAHRGQHTMSAGELLAIGKRALELGKRLKLNTVVHALNVDENLSDFVAQLRPERWKLFQVLPVRGQNDASIDRFEISGKAFARFVQRHKPLREFGVEVVPEDNSDMRGTYAMIDPRGRFYDTVDGEHRYSKPILDVGVKTAWSQVRFSVERFEGRGGIYSWDVAARDLTRKTKKAP